MSLDTKPLKLLSPVEVEYYFEKYYKIKKVEINGAELITILDGNNTFDDYDIKIHMKQTRYDAMVANLKSFQPDGIPRSLISDCKSTLGN
mmetsp:Transcript_17742/g.16018  ORF Transcript_17742/g.16018 Transcript_17742/m.16018 type:complete len:90 (-) Transcript_17742:32-301(-)